MLFRKIEAYIRDYLTSDSNKILIIDGARQIGKSYIIESVGKDIFKEGRGNLLIEKSIKMGEMACCVRLLHPF